MKKAKIILILLSVFLLVSVASNIYMYLETVRLGKEVSDYYYRLPDCRLKN